MAKLAKKNQNMIAVQWLPDIKMFRVVCQSIGIIRDLQWCKDSIDFLTILPHNWKYAMEHPKQVFYI